MSQRTGSTSQTKLQNNITFCHEQDKAALKGIKIVNTILYMLLIAAITSQAIKLVHTIVLIRNVLIFSQLKTYLQCTFQSVNVNSKACTYRPKISVHKISERVLEAK